MKYYKQNNEVFAYELDGSQDYLIGAKVQMTDEEVEVHINPLKTDAQILAEKVAEALGYLVKTNHKFYIGYIPKENEDLVAIQEKRDEALLFIRANDVSL